MLRDAMQATVKDPELLEEAHKSQNNIRYTPPDRMEEIIARAYATNPALVQKIRSVIQE
jgi:hypothetical protein